MSFFPNTPYTLFDAIVQEKNRNDYHWHNFDQIYRPVIRNFIIQRGFYNAELDDVTQEVFLRLVNFLQSGHFDKKRAHFRTLLAKIIRHILIDRYRKQKSEQIAFKEYHREQQSRRLHEDHTSIRQLNQQWDEACYQTALEHVLNNTALSPSHRQIYLECLKEGAISRVIAEKYQTTSAVVRQVRHRVNEQIKTYVKMLRNGTIQESKLIHSSINASCI